MPIYTLQNIQQWLQQQQDLPTKIASKQDQIIRVGLQAERYKEQRNQLIQDKLIPQQRLVDRLQAKIHVLTLPDEIAAHVQTQQHHESERDKYQRQLDQVNGILRPLDANIHKHECAKEYFEKQDGLQVVQNEVARMQSEILSLQTVGESLQSEINQLDSRMIALRNQVASLRPLEYENRQVVEQVSTGYTSSQSAGGYGSSMGNNQTVTRTQRVRNMHITSQLRSLEAQVYQLQQQRQCAENQRSANASESATLRGHVYRYQSEANDLRSRVDALKGQVSGTIASYSNVHAVSQALRHLRNERRPHVTNKKRIEACIRSEGQALSRLANTLSAKHRTYEQAVALVGNNISEHLSNLTITHQNELDALRKIKNEQCILDRAISRDEAEVMQADSDKRHMEDELASLQTNQYLNNLHHSPGFLYEQLNLALQEALVQYELTHSASQSEHVRLALYNIQKQQLAIEEHELDVQVADYRYAEQMRIKYYALSGLLHTMCQHLQATDAAFAGMLNDLLGNNGVESVESQDVFQCFCMQHMQACAPMTAGELPQYERMQYAESARCFEEALRQAPNNATDAQKLMYQRGKQLLKTFDKEVKKADKREHSEFDWKYHATMLNQSCSVLTNPHDKEQLSRYHSFAQHCQHGKPSLTKRILGGMMMFLGAAAAVAGIALATVSAVTEVCSFGFTTPVSAAGGAAGVGLCAGGAALFWHGREKGEKHRLRQFGDAAEQCDQDELGAGVVMPTAPAIGI